MSNSISETNISPEEELISAVNEHGQFVGYMTRKECLEQGHAFEGILLCLKDEDGRILLQKRCTDPQKSFAGMWDVSVAGHCNEEDKRNNLSTAIREAREELGLHLTFDDLKLIDSGLEVLEVKPGKFIKQYGHLISARVDSKQINIENLQKSEVADLQWVTEEQLLSSLLGSPHAFVPRKNVIQLYAKTFENRYSFVLA